MSANGNDAKVPQPSEEPGQKLEDGLKSPSGNLVEMVKITEGVDKGKTKPSFILQTQGYIALKLYAATGLTFPKDATSFQGLHPKDSLKRLTELDASIYQETLDAMVGVHTTSSEFNEKALPNFILTTVETKEYSTYAIEQLKGLGEGSFQGMLDILTSSKYNTVGSENSEEFKGAAKAASDILLDLSKNAEEKATKVKSMLTIMDPFKRRIESDKEKVDRVVKKFRDDGPNKPGLASKLNSTLEQLRRSVSDATNNANAEIAKHNAASDSATKAAWCMFVPFGGWIIAGSVAAKFASDAKNAWEEYNKQLNIAVDKNREEQALQQAIGQVDLLETQNTAMSEKMGTAVAALEEIQGVFAEMAVSLGEASKMMGAADANLRKSLFQRQHMVRTRVDAAVKYWQQALDAADGLLKTNGNIQVVGITPDVTPPKVS